MSGMKHSSSEEPTAKRARYHADKHEAPPTTPASSEQRPGEQGDDERPESSPPLFVSQDGSSADCSISGKLLTPVAADLKKVKPTTNAFAALMSRHPRSKDLPTTTNNTKNNKKPTPIPRTLDNTPIVDPRNPRDNLGKYILDPTKYDPSQVISYDDDFVHIYDMFPKGTVHTLLLPRNLQYTLQQPLEILSQDTDEAREFLHSIKQKVEKIIPQVASELKRRLAPFSKLEQEREKAQEELDKRAIIDPSFDPDSAEAQASLPPGRDWSKCIKIGVHARPSMNHLHIHILSEDLHSDCVKKKNHVNSFSTEFFVRLEEFPLAKDDKRRVGVGNTDHLLKGDMHCWRCKKGFGASFVKMKAHLEEEFEMWKKE